MTTSLKTCFKCGVTKPRHEFYKHKAMADGLLGKCKACTRVDSINNRRKRIEYYREYDRERGNRQTIEDLRRYRRDNPAKSRAHSAVARALRLGTISRMPCEVCGANKAHAHHDDYTRPLDVRWLCAAHHQQWHTENGEAKAS